MKAAYEESSPALPSMDNVIRGRVPLGRAGSRLDSVGAT